MQHFNRKLLWCSLFVVFSAFPLCAENYPHAEAGVELEIPDSWQVEAKADVVVAHSETGQVAFFLYILEANQLNNAVDAMTKKLGKMVSEVKLKKRLRKAQLNGMPAVVGRADAQYKETPVELAIALLQSPKQKIVLVFTMADKQAPQKARKALMKIVSSIKPFEAQN